MAVTKQDEAALWTERDAAALLRMRPETLASWRYLGKGPKYIRAGRAIRYRPSDVIGWLEERSQGGDAA